jgi:hypothetical protein
MSRQENMGTETPFAEDQIDQIVAQLQGEDVRQLTDSGDPSFPASARTFIW